MSPSNQLADHGGDAFSGLANQSRPLVGAAKQLAKTLVASLHLWARVDPTSTDATRQRILAAAGRLLSEGEGEGDAASTRAVSAGAGVQASTLYRLFGDKQGLLDAVAVDALERYLATKTRRSPGPDPVDDLRTGWDEHVAFGLANPEVYVLVYRQRDDLEGPAPSRSVSASALRRTADQPSL